MEPQIQPPGTAAPHPETPATLLPTRHVDRELLGRLAPRVTTATRRPGLAVRAPFTGEVLAEVPDATPDDVELAARLARRAQRRWAELPFADRARVFLRLHDLVLERQEQILDLIQLESGKSRANAFEEIADVAIVARYYAIHGDDHIAPKRRMGALPGLTTTWQYHHPRGLVGFIAPWNYPLTLAITDAIPALLAGNGVLLKPDRQTPLSALWIADLVYEAGLPPDLFQVVTGSGARLGKPIIDHVDYVCFTGSTDTGRIIASQAGERLIGCSLELGGKNALLVLDDADLENAAQGAVRGCFSNTGQLCISFERIYAQSGIYDRFVERFVEATRKLRLGSELSFDLDVGCLVSQSQLETVQRHVDDAVSKGARILAGGRPRPDLGPLFYEPTILTDVREGMILFDQETFGPVVSVYRFDAVEEAIERTNSTQYGLNGSVWTRNTARGREIAARIHAGTVNVNEAYAATWASVDAPMGGFKDSGLGRRHGHEGILKYTESQTVAVQRFLPIAAPPGVGHETFAKVMTGALKVLKRVPGLR